MNSASVTDIFGTILNNNRSRQVLFAWLPDSVVVSQFYIGSGVKKYKAIEISNSADRK